MFSSYFWNVLDINELLKFTKVIDSREKIRLMNFKNRGQSFLKIKLKPIFATCLIMSNEIKMRTNIFSIRLEVSERHVMAIQFRELKRKHLAFKESPKMWLQCQHSTPIDTRGHPHTFAYFNSSLGYIKCYLINAP